MTAYEEKKMYRRRERKTAPLEKIVIGLASFAIAVVFWLGKYRTAGSADPFKVLWLWGILAIVAGLVLQIWRNGKK